MTAEGLPSKQMAGGPSASAATIKAHVTAITRKQGVHHRARAALAASGMALHQAGMTALRPDDD